MEIKTEEETKNKKYTISADIYIVLQSLVNENYFWLNHPEFCIGVLKGLIKAQGIEEVKSKGEQND